MAFLKLIEHFSQLIFEANVNSNLLFIIKISILRKEDTVV